MRRIDAEQIKLCMAIENVRKILYGYCMKQKYLVELIFTMFAYLVGFAKIRIANIYSTRHKLSSLFCFSQIVPLIAKIRVISVKPHHLSLDHITNINYLIDLNLKHDAMLLPANQWNPHIVEWNDPTYSKILVIDVKKWSITPIVYRR